MRYILYILFVVITPLLMAQQEGLYTLYMYNTSAINAGYTGSKAGSELILHHRSQWGGIDGAPQTTYLGFETALPKYDLGLGVNVRYDELGPLAETEIAINVAYHLQVGIDSHLAFGLKGIGNMFQVDFSKLNVYNPQDPYFLLDVDQKFTPDWGMGFYYYTSNYYAGVSATTLLQNSHFKSSVNTLKGSDEIHYYGMAGYLLPINSMFLVKPALLTKYVSGASAQIDLSANVLYKELLVVGGAYRVGAAVSWLMGFYISPTLFVGYAYDYDTSLMRYRSRGSHELFIKFDLFKNKGEESKINLPRFF